MTYFFGQKIKKLCQISDIFRHQILVKNEQNEFY